MRRREQQLLRPRIVVPARRPPLPGADAAHVAAVDLHRENLIAGVVGARGLEDETSAVRREIGLGVLAAKRELLDAGQVTLGRGGALGAGEERDADQKEENGGRE